MSYRVGINSIVFSHKVLGYLIICLLIAAAGTLCADSDNSGTNSYKSNLEFTLDYPSGWSFADKTNIKALKNELMLKGNDYNEPYRNTVEGIIRKIENRECAVVFFDTTNTVEPSTIQVKLVPGSIKPAETSVGIFKQHLPAEFMTDRKQILEEKLKVVKTAKTKCLSLQQTLVSAADSSITEAHAILITGENRSFIITTMIKPDIGAEQQSIMNYMSNSFVENRHLYKGLFTLPHWIEWIVLGIFGLIIVVLARKVLGEYQTKPKSIYERQHKGFHIGFLPSLIAIWILLIVVAFLVKSCYATVG